MNKFKTASATFFITGLVIAILSNRILESAPMIASTLTIILLLWEQDNNDT